MEALAEQRGHCCWALEEAGVRQHLVPAAAEEAGPEYSEPTAVAVEAESSLPLRTTGKDC